MTVEAYGKRFSYGSPDLFRDLEQFSRSGAGGNLAAVTEGVRTILEDVRARGDAAVVEHLARIDKVELAPDALRVPPEVLRAAAESLDAETREAIGAAIASVRAFHRQGLPRSWKGRNLHGALVGEQFFPLERVGIYIPGGHVPLVSTVIMTAVPAKLAGVRSVVGFTPPGRQGKPNEGILAAFHLCGVDEVYRIGGPMAVGAMAYGTERIDPVVKIFGPGNAYVAEAKRQVLGTVGIDLIAGPSEVTIVADGSANPAYVAADLIAQAEHGSGAEKVYLVTVGAPDLRERVAAELSQQIPVRKHADLIRKVLSSGYAVIECATLEDAGIVTNFLAPEHLELQMERDAQAALMQQVSTAGAIFLGHDTPTVLGDFAAGPNHTLPTVRTGRFYSGLQTIDFMRRSSFTRYDRKSLKRAAPIVQAFARLEQLDGHGESLERRLRQL